MGGSVGGRVGEREGGGRMGGRVGASSSHLISDCPPIGILQKTLHSLVRKNQQEIFKMSFFKAKKGGAAASKEEMRHRREVNR